MVAADRAVVQPSYVLTGTAVTGMPWRALTLIACVGLAYWQPLIDLMRGMRYDTPLAYLGITPFFAIALGCWQYYHTPASESASGRSDIAIGTALIAGALLTGAGAPIVLHISAWTTRLTVLSLPAYAASKRLDLLSLPIFAAGLIVLLYGRKALRWAWPALAYGIFVWPAPASSLLTYALPWLSHLTVGVVAALSALFPVGAVANPADGTLFTITTPHGAQELSIGSVCSGFNSVLAWMLVGIAVGIVVRKAGSRRYDVDTAIRLASWLLIGVLAVFASNIVRIIGLFALAHTFGIGVAFESVHVSIGMILLTLIVVGMFAILPRFGLALPLSERRVGRVSAEAESVRPAIRTRVSLAALTAIGFAIGLLFRIGILRLALALGCAYVCLCLFLLAAPVAEKIRPHLPGAGRAIRLWHRLFAAAVAVLATGVFTALMAIALSLKRMRAAYIPALGWRIDEGHIGALNEPLRYSMAALLCIVAVLLMRRLTDPRDTATRAGAPSYQKALLWWAREGLVAATLVGSAVAMALTTVTVASYSEPAAVSRTSLMRDFDSAPPEVPGVAHTFVREYEWPKQSLGKNATYRRFRYDALGGQPLWIDVITTDDADALAQHNVPSCYNFHSYRDEGSRRFDIGNDTNASLINYWKPDVDETWSALYWEQRVSRGGRIFFQRIVMLDNLENPPGSDVKRAYFAAHDVYMQSRAMQILNGLIVRNEG